MSEFTDTSTHARLRPDFIMIGAEKSGSTFLMQRLIAHPQIFMPSPAATQFLLDPLYTAEWDELHALFENVPSGKIKGLRRNRYLREPKAAPFVRAHFPDARLIVLLRHPLARVISAYFQAMWLDLVPIEPLNRGLPKLLQGAYDEPLAHQLIIRDGLYYTNLSRYRDFFTRGQCLTLILDDFKTDAAQQMRAVYRFVGAAEDFTPQSLSSKENTGIYSLARVRLRQAYRKRVYWRTPDGTQVHLLHQSFSQRAMAAFLRRIDRYLLAPFLKQPMPLLTSSLAQQLLEFYRPEVEQLEALLNRRLDAWKVWQAPTLD